MYGSASKSRDLSGRERNKTGQLQWHLPPKPFLRARDLHATARAALCDLSVPRHHVHLCRRNRPVLSLLSQGTTGKQLVLNKCSVMSSLDSPAGPRPASGGRCQGHGLSHWVCAGIWGKAGVGTLQAAGTGPDRRVADSLQAGSLVVQGKGVWMS